MIKRTLQLVGAGLNYAVMFSVGFVFALMLFCGFAWAVDTLLESVTVTDPVYDSWFHTFIIAAGFLISLIVGIICLGIEEKKRKSIMTEQNGRRG